MRPMTPGRPETAPVLSCAGLRKSFGDRVAVDGVSFRIGPSETYGLLGPNGAGKTTTISMICGLLVRDAGEVEVVGQPQLGVLFAAAVVVLALATWRLRVALTR